MTLMQQSVQKMNGTFLFVKNNKQVFYVLYLEYESMF